MNKEPLVQAGVQVDVTAWVIEALSLVDTAKYQEVIDQALATFNLHKMKQVAMLIAIWESM